MYSQCLFLWVVRIHASFTLGGIGDCTFAFKAWLEKICGMKTLRKCTSHISCVKLFVISHLGSQQQPSIAVLLWLSLQQLTRFTASLWPSIKTFLHTLQPITLAGMKDETDEYGGQKVHKPSPRLNQDVYIIWLTRSARINKQLKKGLNVLWY